MKKHLEGRMMKKKMRMLDFLGNFKPISRRSIEWSTLWQLIHEDIMNWWEYDGTVVEYIMVTVS